MKITRILFAISLVVGLMVACSATPPQPTQSPLGSSPLASPTLSPLPQIVSGPAVPFQLDRPVLAGTSVVRGTGPAGVPIYLADVTFMGDPLGTGTIGPDGKFEINVRPLEAGHRIGLALSELAGTPFKPEQFYPAEFHGPEAMQLPQVGFFWDTTMVPSK
jgi:hypothetical protein